MLTEIGLCKQSRVSRRRRLRPFLSLCAIAGSLFAIGNSRGAGVSSAFASTDVRSHFFATLEACAAFGAFSRPECANAFANAETEMRAHAPNFTTKFDCEIRFRLCGSRSSASSPIEDQRSQSGSFSPIMLGIEISGRSRMVTPVIAVVPPAGTFRTSPISQRRASDAIASTFGRSQILRADRFEPMRVEFDPPQARATNGAQNPAARAERREWLKSLPFVE